MGLTYLSVSEYNALLLRNIRVRCVEMNTSIPKIEKALGYGNGAISGWSKAKRYAPMSRIEAVAEYLGCTVSELVGETEKPASISAGGLDGVNLLSPALLEELSRFVRLAKANPERALRFLAFANQEIESQL